MAIYLRLDYDQGDRILVYNRELTGPRALICIVQFHNDACDLTPYKQLELLEMVGTFLRGKDKPRYKED